MAGSSGDGVSIAAERAVAKDGRYERWRWTVFAATWLGYAGFYLTRKSFAVAKIGMLHDPAIHVNKTTLGLIDGAFLLSYALGQFIFGVAGDRFSSHRIVTIGMLVSVGVAVAMGASSAAILLGVLFFIQGLAQSSGWAPLTKNIGCWFSRRERGRMYGWWCTNYTIGGLVATPFAGYMADRFHDWRYAFFIPAAALFGIWLIFVVGQRDRPEDVGLPPVEEYRGESGPSVAATENPAWDAGSVFRNRVVLRLAVVAFFLKPMQYGILLWGPLIVNETIGAGMAKSGLISALFEGAGALGMLLCGYASDKLFHSRRVPACVISLLALAVVTFSFHYLTQSGSAIMLGATFFAIGLLLFGPESVLVSSAAVDFGTSKGASSAVGIINGSGGIGAVLGASLLGVISQRCGWGPIFYAFGGAVLISAFLLIPKWNAVPSHE